MTPLRSLLSPKSIAVVGASAARPTAGTAVITNLKRLEYTGHVYPVNPNYEEVEGLRCYPSLAAIPGDIDVAFLGVPAETVVPLVMETGARGIRRVVVTASGFADAGPDGAALQSRLVDAAAASSMAVCGPNNMGIVNWLDGVAIWTGTLTPPPRTGPIGVISQSGSVSMLCAADDRNIGFGIIIGSGNEAVTTSAEYLDALVRDDRIHVILHFVETVKRPQAYAMAAVEAQRRGKPIIVLKVGRTELGRRATVAHTGSLAGADEEFDAFSRRYDLIRVTTLDEMLELAQLFTKAGRRPQRDSVCLIAMSGGEVALLSDLAADAGLPLSEFTPETNDALTRAFPPYSTIANPLDAWGAGWNPQTYRTAVEALMRDPSIGVIACAIDPDARNARANTPVSQDMAALHRRLLAEAPAHAPTVVFFNNISAALSPVIAEALEGSGIPYLQGAPEALSALRHWVQFYHKARRPVPHVDGTLVGRVPSPPPALAVLLERARGSVLDELASSTLVTAYGIPVARSALARTVSEAVNHAREIGFPVVLKVASQDLPHKSDVGGVVLNLRTATQVRAAFRAIVKRIRETRPEVTVDGVVIAEIVPAGLEMMLGASISPYGPMILVGDGGVDVETRRDVAVALAPLDAEEAEAMLGRLKISPLLGAARGRPARDRAALIDLLLKLSRLAWECGPWLAAIDLNPVIVQDEGRGACAVDALVVLRDREGTREMVP